MVLNPASPVAFVEEVLHLCDIVLVMSVTPGFGGQPFLPEVLAKIRELRRRCVARGLDPWIEVDGGQSGENAWQAVDAGADALVAGSAVFGSLDYAAAIARLRSHPRGLSGGNENAMPSFGHTSYGDSASSLLVAQRSKH